MLGFGDIMEQNKAELGQDKEKLKQMGRVKRDKRV